jgi:hypothetical protein
VRAGEFLQKLKDDQRLKNSAPCRYYMGVELGLSLWGKNTHSRQVKKRMRRGIFRPKSGKETLERKKFHTTWKCRVMCEDNIVNPKVSSRTRKKVFFKRQETLLTAS